MIYVLKENKFDYSGIKDFEGKKIGVIRGWSYGKILIWKDLRSVFYVDEVNCDDVNFNKLMGGRLDCLLAIKETADYLMYINPEYRKKIVQIETPLLVSPTYLIFPKSMHKLDLLKKFNEELKEMKENSEIEILFEDYLKK